MGELIFTICIRRNHILQPYLADCFVQVILSDIICIKFHEFIWGMCVKELEGV